MRDYKTTRSSQATATRYTRTKVKANRRREKPKPPRDWKAFFRRLFLFGKWAGLAGATVGAVLLLFGAGKYLIYDSPFFRVDAIRVVTSGRIDAQQICDRSEIRRGSSMFDLDLDQIGARIEEDPWIATARVERVFPRNVTVEVTEYEPAAIVNLGCLYYVAADGTVFKPLEMGEKIDYPLLTGIEQKDILERPEEVRQLFAGAVRLSAVLRSRASFDLGKVSEIHIDATEGYDLMTLAGGVPIRIGFDDFEMKLNRLERIYSELEPRLPVTQYIDLTAVDRVIVKLDPILTQPKQQKS